MGDRKYHSSGHGRGARCAFTVEYEVGAG